MEGWRPRVFLADGGWQGVHGQHQTRAATERAAALKSDSAHRIYAVCQSAQESPPQLAMKLLVCSDLNLALSPQAQLDLVRA